jgi:hypothetical protein
VKVQDHRNLSGLDEELFNHVEANKPYMQYGFLVKMVKWIEGILHDTEK